MAASLRLVRVQLLHVLDVEAIVSSTCLGGLRRSTLYAELRLFGEGVAYTPAFQTLTIAPGQSWENEIMDLHLTEQDMYTRVLGISLYAVDLLGLSVTLGEAKVPLTPLELLKHQVVIVDDIHLTEETTDYEEVTTCRLKVHIAVWTNADVDNSLTLEVWEHERYAHGHWSKANLILNDQGERDRLPYACGDRTSQKWEDIEPEVPAGYVEVLGWAPDRSQGDEHGWFYAPTFDGPWHNTTSSFACRRRRQIKRVLLATYQASKQAQFELMQLDHTILVQQFEDVQRLLKARWRELQEQEARHEAQLAASEAAHHEALAVQEAAYLDQIQKHIQAHEATKQREADLSEQVRALEDKLRALEDETLGWRQQIAAENDARAKDQEIQRKRTSTSPRLFRVQLHRALDLPAADSALMGGKSDPYVIFEIDGVKHKSTMIKCNLNPVWYNEVYDFEMTEARLNGASLLVHVYDHDQFSPDELIGFTSIPLDALDATNDPREPMWFSLHVPTEFSSQKRKATLQLQFEFGNWLDQDAVQLVMWENERHARGQWSANNLKANVDRGAWICGNQSAMKREEVCPKIPLGMESYLGWAVDRNHGDEQGWFYAASFDGPWFNGANASSVVRRRKWTQRCTPRSMKNSATVERSASMFVNGSMRSITGDSAAA